MVTPRTALGGDGALAGWKRQLDEQVAPYVREARDRSHGVQVILFLRPDGKIGDPKVTITTAS